MQKKYALIIGNSIYEDQLLTKLNAPKVDVDRLAELLKSPEIGNFDVIVLKDAPFTDVRLAIVNLFAEKKRDDLVLLYFSGHGLKDERGELHLAVKDTRRNRLRAAAIETDFIRTEMNNSRARRQVLILDCCFSGAFTKGFKGEYAPVMTNSTFQIQGYGKVVLTASNSTQYAFEGDRVISGTTNSLFTHFLLEGLENGQADQNNDGIITVDEWYDYAYEQIENSRATQRPQIFVDSQEGSPIEIARTRFIGSYLTKDLLPVANIQRRIRRVANFIATLPTLPLIPDDQNSWLREENHNRNTVIQADNLLAMKAIFSKYVSKIKCVYIDPPYYLRLHKLEFQKAEMKEKKKKGEPSSPGEELDEPWIEMMYPRLLLLRELMSDDGIIFVSIDDNQLHNLKWLMDNVFSSLNWVCTFVWRRRNKPGIGNRFGASVDHEYILCYSRSTDFRFKGTEREFDINRYSNPDNDPRGPWVSVNLIGSGDKVSRPNMVYKITDPQTGITYSPPTSRAWRFSKEKMKSLIEEGQILWPKTLSGQPRQKRYLVDVQESLGPISSVIDLPTVSHTRFETDDGLVFGFAKPVELIKHLMNQIPYDDFIVLDAFAGSGTTGQAILELNQQDGGKRNFVLIEENPEICHQFLVNRLKNAIERLNTPLQESSNFQLLTLSAEN
jgi:DNA modification methylase